MRTSPSESPSVERQAHDPAGKHASEFSGRQGVVQSHRIHKADAGAFELRLDELPQLHRGNPRTLTRHGPLLPRSLTAEGVRP